MAVNENDNNNLVLKDFKVKSMPPTAYYISDFLTPAEEEALAASVMNAPRPKWNQLSGRRVQNWGGVPTQRGMIAERIPSWLQSAMDRVTALGAFPKPPNHVLVNEYLPGQGIMPHLDGAVFAPTIATISICGSAVLRFRDAGALFLEPRSLVVLKDNLYTDHLHYIEETHKDFLDESVANLSQCSSEYRLGDEVPRATRISLTIRHVPKTTAFKISIGHVR